MKFFNIKDMARSWSVQALALLGTGAVADHFTGFFTSLFPQHQSLIVAGISFFTLLLRTIKQERK